jgi:cytidylate kinase
VTPCERRKVRLRMIPAMNRSGVRQRLLYAGPVLVYALLIFIVPSITKFPDVTPVFFGFDKLAHFCEYYLFGFLIYRWLTVLETPFFKRRSTWITLFIGTVYGLGDEWHQAFLPGRDASLWDVLFDGLGVLAAAVTYRVLMERIRSWNRRFNRPRSGFLVKEGPVITIDGPAGAGKSTISRLLAERLSFIYLDTGALYRAMAYRLDCEGWDGTEESLTQLCRRIKVEMRKIKDQLRVFANGEDVTQEIRTEKIGLLASQISAAAAVREVLLSIQRDIAGNGGVVAEGRDMGSVVFPDAELKFFLDASAWERTKRRYLELTKKGASVSLHEIEQDLLRRDSQDRNRAISPLTIPSDALVIDTTDKTISQVIDIMWSAIVDARPCLAVGKK